MCRRRRTRYRTPRVRVVAVRHSASTPSHLPPMPTSPIVIRSPNRVRRAGPRPPWQTCRPVASALTPPRLRERPSPTTTARPPKHPLTKVTRSPRRYDTAGLSPAPARLAGSHEVRGPVSPVTISSSIARLPHRVIATAQPPRADPLLTVDTGSDTPWWESRTDQRLLRAQAHPPTPRRGL